MPSTRASMPTMCRAVGKLGAGMGGLAGRWVVVIGWASGQADVGVCGVG